MYILPTQISRNMKLKAANGKEMTAMKVFTSSIKFLKDDLLKLCETRGADINMSDIRWVLTVPTIWNDRAKQFMRECAEGVNNMYFSFTNSRNVTFI